MWEGIVYSLVVVALPSVGLFFVASLSGRRWLFLVPVIGWPLFYLGLHQGWWGYGVGDWWQVPAAGLMILSLAAVTLGRALHRFADGDASRHES